MIGDEQAQADLDMLEAELEERMNKGLDSFVGKPWDDNVGHMSQVMDKVLREYLQELLDQGIIEPYLNGVWECEEPTPEEKDKRVFPKLNYVPLNGIKYMD